MLPYSFSIAPFAIVAGATATAFNKYRPQNVIAWVFVTIGMGLQSTLGADSATRNWVGFQIVAGIGFGMLVSPTDICVRRCGLTQCHCAVHRNHVPHPRAAPGHRQRQCTFVLHLHPLVLPGTQPHLPPLLLGPHGHMT